MVLMRNNSWIWLIICTILIIGSCTDKLGTEMEPPDDLIPRDTMINIMVDFRLMDASLIQEQRVANPKVYDLKYYMYLSILDKYGITRQQFKTSFDYYQNDLNVIDEMFAESITRLSKMKSELKNEE